jgi:hypothetical protein
MVTVKPVTDGLQATFSLPLPLSLRLALIGLS